MVVVWCDNDNDYEGDNHEADDEDDDDECFTFMWTMGELYGGVPNGPHLIIPFWARGGERFSKTGTGMALTPIQKSISVSPRLSSPDSPPFQFLPSSVPQFLPVSLLAAVFGSPDPMILHEPAAWWFCLLRYCKKLQLILLDPTKDIIAEFWKDKAASKRFFNLLNYLDDPLWRLLMMATIQKLQCAIWNQCKYNLIS